MEYIRDIFFMIAKNDIFQSNEEPREERKSLEMEIFDLTNF